MDRRISSLVFVLLLSVSNFETAAPEVTKSTLRKKQANPIRSDSNILSKNSNSGLDLVSEVLVFYKDVKPEVKQPRVTDVLTDDSRHQDSSGILDRYFSQPFLRDPKSSRKKLLHNTGVITVGRKTKERRRGTKIHSTSGASVSTRHGNRNSGHEKHTDIGTLTGGEIANRQSGNNNNNNGLHLYSPIFTQSKRYKKRQSGYGKTTDMGILTGGKTVVRKKEANHFRQSAVPTKRKKKRHGENSKNIDIGLQKREPERSNARSPQSTRAVSSSSTRFRKPTNKAEGSETRVPRSTRAVSSSSTRVKKRHSRDGKNTDIGIPTNKTERSETRVPRSTRATSSRFKNCLSEHEESSVGVSIRSVRRWRDRTQLPTLMRNYPAECGSEAGHAIHAEDGILTFQTPCCAIECVYQVTLVTDPSKVLMIEFLDLHVPSAYKINSDGSTSCEDTKVYISPSFMTLCGSRIPRPMKTSTHLPMVYVITKQNFMCRDNISYKLKYRVCDAETPEERCLLTHSQAQDGESGILTSPGYKDNDTYPTFNACNWMLEVSNTSVLRLSFQFYQLSFDSSLVVTSFSLLTTDMSYTTLTFTDADYRVRQGYYFVLPHNAASVMFTTMYSVDKGFKMLYEAVSKEEYIPIVDKFKLNCTGYEHSLPAHTRCNLYEDCVGGEDERNCSYIDETACAGGHVFGMSCYHLYVSHPQGTWQVANDMCQQQHNGHLITPDTEKEFAFISELVALSASYWAPWYLGVQQFPFDSQPLYRKLYQGLDGTTIFNGQKQLLSSEMSACTVWDFHRELMQREMMNIKCGERWKRLTFSFRHTLQTSKMEEPRVYTACESKISFPHTVQMMAPHTTNIDWSGKLNTFQCTKTEERISVSRVCDGAADCRDESDESSCDQKETSEHFFCKSGSPVWYSHVCDGVTDCLDNSDEEFCLPVPNDEDPNVEVCANGQSVPSSSWCDAKPDCLDGSDELGCRTCNGGAILCPSVGCFPSHWVDDDSLDCPVRDKEGHWLIEPDFVKHVVSTQPPPGVVYPDGYGKVKIQPLEQTEPCPPTHARCPDGYCIPVYMLCNGYKDCPQGEDEMKETCNSFCKGRYKCHKASICLHDDHVCDGWFHCPLHDDEMFCFVSKTCPEDCVCSGKEITCKSHPQLQQTGQVKRMEIFHANFSNNSLDIKNHQLISLVVRKSNIRRLGSLNSVNLHKLDLSDNHIKHLDIGVFAKATNIHSLSLARNKLTNKDLQEIKSLKSLEILDISGNPQKLLRSSSFAGCSNLRTLHLDDMDISEIESGAFTGLPALQSISMTGNPISVFQQNVLSNLPQLSSLSAENYKLCCPAIMPKSLSRGTCRAPTDEISSCEDILRTPFYRAFLWLVVLLTILGNSAALIYRFFVERKRSTRGFKTFVTNLNVSDLLMGIYLAIIGGADQVFRGTYLWQAGAWTSSTYCSLAGFLCMVSSEVSVIIICLITLDRYLALAFPMANVLMTTKRARIVMLITWAVCALLAAIPLLPPLAHWEFYSQNGVCVPLPITRTQFPGSDYAFVIFILLNFFLFLCIAVGQLLIFRSVTENRLEVKGAKAQRRHQDIAIAEKLILVAATDLLCWFPIGVMGLLSKTGVPIPGEANVVVTIFILPLNSALNPYLYTLPAVREKLKERKKKRKRDDAGKFSSTSWSITRYIKSGNANKRSTTRQRPPCKNYMRSRSVSAPEDNGTSSSSVSTQARFAARVVTPEMCLAKTRLWLRTGRMSSHTVRKILASL